MALFINELQLPAALEADLTSGNFTLAGFETERLGRLLTHLEKPMPALYGLKSIQRENKFWTSPASQNYKGSPSEVYAPGDIDPRLALIIGQADPDSPIALDYRTEPPRVVYLGDARHEIHWLELAASYEMLIAKLRSFS